MKQDLKCKNEEIQQAQRDLKDQLARKNTEIQQSHLKASIAAARVRQQHEQAIEAASENHKRTLARANEDRLECQKQLDAVRKRLKAAETANTRLRSQSRVHQQTIANLRKSPVDSFAKIFEQLKQRHEGGSFPDDCDADRYTVNTPKFVLNKLRSIHRFLWAAHVKQMMRILGWTVGRSQDKGFGGTVCVAFCLLAAQDPGLDHGCWNPASLLTALCHSNSGRSILQQALVASNSLKRAHKAALQKGAQVAAFQVATAALGSGVPKRGRASILAALPHNPVTERKVADAMKELKTSVKNSAGVRPTGTDGAAALFFKALSLAFEIMPFRNNVVMKGIHSSCLFRAGILRIAARLKTQSAPPNSEYIIDRSVQGEGHLTHVSLGERLRQKLLQWTGFSDKHWTDHGTSLFIHRSKVVMLLQEVLDSGSGLPIPDYLLQEVVDMYCPHGAHHMLLKQVDRLFCEALILSQLPIFHDLTTTLNSADDYNYWEEDPYSDQSPTARDWKLLQILRNAKPESMGLPNWPPGCASTHIPNWTSSLPAFAAAEITAATTICNRLLSATPKCVVGVTWDAAKIANASLLLQNLQSAIHCSDPVLQQKLFNKQAAEKAARTRNVSSDAGLQGDSSFVLNRIAGGAQTYAEVRCPFAKYMCGQDHLMPLGAAVIDKENASVIETHIKVHHGDIKNCCSWLNDQPLGPGLHFHFTKSGQDALDKSDTLEACMVSSVIGRDLSAAGKCAVLKIPPVPHIELDMKGLWEWLRAGGWSDTDKLRCPWCTDKNAMHLRRSHKAVLSSMVVTPGETLQQFADRADMYLFDILIYNWSELRQDSAIDPFFEISDHQKEMVRKGRNKLTSLSTSIPCFSEVVTSRKSLHDGNEWPSELRRRVEEQMGSLVLDSRPCANRLVYVAHSRLAAMSNPEWKPVAGGWETLWPERPQLALLILGSDDGPRQLKLLKSLHLSPSVSPGCVLHCRLRMVPAFLKSLHAVILTMPSKEIQKTAFEQVNKFTEEANFGKQLRMGFMDEVDKTGEAKNGCPAPSGRACEWAARHLEEIATRALENWPLVQKAKKIRLVRLARYMTDVLDDLLRCDWTRRIGTTWVLVEDGTRNLNLDPCGVMAECDDEDRILDSTLIANLQSSFNSSTGVAVLPRRFLKNLILGERSYAVIQGEEGSMIALRPCLELVDKHEEFMLIQMPQRLKHLGSLWMAFHDSFAVRDSWNAFYLHEIIHHIGTRWNHMRGLGFSGLGVKSNSALERMHQVYGKWSMLHSWIVVCSRQKSLSRRIVRMPVETQEESGGENLDGEPTEKQSVGDSIRHSGLTPEELAESVLGFDALIAQISRKLGTSMCAVCLHPQTQCREMAQKGYACSVSRRGAAGLYGFGRAEDDTAEAESGDILCPPTENSTVENDIRDRALMEHLAHLYQKQKQYEDTQKSGREVVIKVKPSSSRAGRVRTQQLLDVIHKIQSRPSFSAANKRKGDSDRISIPRTQASVSVDLASGTATLNDAVRCVCRMCGQNKACATQHKCAGVTCDFWGSTKASDGCQSSVLAAFRCKRYQTLAWLAGVPEDDQVAEQEAWVKAVADGGEIAVKVWLQNFGGVAPSKNRGEGNKVFTARLRNTLKTSVTQALKTFKIEKERTARGNGDGESGRIDRRDCEAHGNARGARDTAAGDDGGGPGRRECDVRVVDGRGGIERDASTEPGGDRVGVGGGARGEHGACDVGGTGSGGAHGMRVDGVGEGMSSPQLRDGSDELGQGWLGPSADLPSDTSDGDNDVQITHTSPANGGKPPSPVTQKQACCVCGGTREEDMLECIRCNRPAHSCCYYQPGSKAEGDSISAGDEWECEDCGGWPQWRPTADPGAPAPRPAGRAQTAAATAVSRGCFPAAAPRHPVVAEEGVGWGGISVTRQQCHQPNMDVDGMAGEDDHDDDDDDDGGGAVEPCEICGENDESGMMICSQCYLPVHQKCYSVGRARTQAVSNPGVWKCFQCGGPSPKDEHKALGGFIPVGQREFEFNGSGEKVLRLEPTAFQKKGAPMTLPSVFLRGTRVGRGVFANEDLPRNTIVAEYTGELITSDEAMVRLKAGTSSHIRKITEGYCLDGSIRDELGYTLHYYTDVTGDVGSFFNSYQNIRKKKNCIYFGRDQHGKGKHHVIPSRRDLEGKEDTGGEGEGGAGRARGGGRGRVGGAGGAARGAEGSRAGVGPAGTSVEAGGGGGGGGGREGGGAISENVEGNRMHKVTTVPRARVYLRTTCAVRKGQQLLTTYGGNYFRTQDQECHVETAGERGGAVGHASKRRRTQDAPEKGHTVGAIQTGGRGGARGGKGGRGGKAKRKKK